MSRLIYDGKGWMLYVGPDREIYLAVRQSRDHGWDSVRMSEEVLEELEKAIKKGRPKIPKDD